MYSRSTRKRHIVCRAPYCMLALLLSDKFSCFGIFVFVFVFNRFLFSRFHLVIVFIIFLF